MPFYVQTKSAQQAKKRSSGSRPRRRRTAAGQRQRYFDYELLIVIVFLIGFGLVMLYSTSYYQAQLKYDGDGFHYFKRQG